MESKVDRNLRRRLDEFYAHNDQVLRFEKPDVGWIRAIRKSVGMSMESLGRRMGVIKQRVERIEKDELESKLTLETMNKVAEALECEFVYFLIPKSGSLSDTIQARAELVAEKLAKEIQGTMKLEKQAIDKSDLSRMKDDLKRDLLQKKDRRLWKKS